MPVKPLPKSSAKPQPLHPNKTTLKDYRATFALAMKASLWCVAGALIYFFALMVLNGSTHGSSAGYAKQFGDRIVLEKGGD